MTEENCSEDKPVDRPSNPFNITLEEAKEIWADKSNGCCEGTSSSKGGRAWLSGEFRLCELEALCVLLRHEAGEFAEGARELIDIQNDID